MVDLATAMPWYLVSGVMTSVVSGPFIDIVKFLTNNHTTRLVTSLRNVTQLPLPAAARTRGRLIYVHVRHVSYCCKTDF